MKSNSDSIQKRFKHYFTKRRITGIVGSPRKNGNSDVLLNHILRGAKEENVFTDRIHLRDYQFQPCIGCEKCRKDKIHPLISKE